MPFKKSRQSNLRQGRYDESGLFYFLTAIIKDRESLLSNPAAAQIVLDALKWLNQEERISLVASVVMPDHIHFVA
ncbi:MAG: transposase, partial [Deltaproteobacteria bacterium]|nr:transposase [Deltaproteobacteria bacterium]